MSFSLPQGLVIDHLRARLLCGHHGYLASRLCQPMGIPVILLFVIFLQPLPRVAKLCTPSVACPVCSYPSDENFRFASNVAM